MTSLKRISKWENGFEDKLPKSLGNLCNLQTLDFSGNNFHATLLHDFLESVADCTKKSLKILYLDRNQFGGSFPHLYGNQLEGPLSNLHYVPSTLEVLSAASNSFSGMVSDTYLQKLLKLQHLVLSDISLTFNLSSNWIPPFQLVTIRLSSCNLASHFPNWIKIQLLPSDLDISNTNISYLILSFNHISAWPNFPLRFDNQPIIDLSSNQFHGSVPLSLSNAIVLNLSNNTLTRFEPFLCTLTDRPTVFLDLSNNLLSESLPDCWMHWKELEIPILDNNKLYGIISSSLASQYQIQPLRLRQNNLSGNFASSLKNCTQLLLLDVGENNLTGDIPMWIGESLTNLHSLSLKSNGYHRSIPSNICHFRSIQVGSFTQ